jgi:hypothetical protein
MALEFGKIDKLKIWAYKDAEMTRPVAGGPFIALINPETYSHKHKVEFCETQAPGTSGVALKYNKTTPQEYSFDFLFDATGVFKGASVLDFAVTNPFESGKDVSVQIEEFKKKVFDYNGDVHRPNYLMIIWGSLLIKGVLTSLDIEYKLFNTKGIPIRAIAKCSIKETLPEKLRTATEDSQSPDITHERIFTASDRLSLMTNDIYNNQNYYTDVAAFNQLDGFRKIKPGEIIQFPQID